MNCTKELGLSLWDADSRAREEKAQRTQLASMLPAQGGDKTISRPSAGLSLLWLDCAVMLRPRGLCRSLVRALKS